MRPHPSTRPKVNHQYRPGSHLLSVEASVPLTDLASRRTAFSTAHCRRSSFPGLSRVISAFMVNSTRAPTNSGSTARISSRTRPVRRSGRGPTRKAVRRTSRGFAWVNKASTQRQNYTESGIVAPYEKCRNIV